MPPKPEAAESGALLVDKPSGPTSHDVVAVVRRTLGMSRVGHTGTLDPLATGLLVMLIGPATRLARFLAADEKEYVADIRLGVATPTYDAASLADGVPDPIANRRFAEDDVMAVMDRFRGSYLQVPPPYSAKKVAGVAAYEKARRNQPVDLKPVRVTVQALDVLSPPVIANKPSSIGHRDLLRLRVAASAGFYVRSLAHEVGQALGCGAHLEQLRRTRVGRFSIDNALTLDRLAEHASAGLIPMNELLGEMPAIALTETGVRRVVHGNPVDLESSAGGNRAAVSRGTDAVPCFLRLLDEAGELLAVAEARPDGLLHPVVVLR